MTCRLVVRRVKRLNPTSSGKDGQRSVQEELFAAYRHHAFVTNSTLGKVDADTTHRAHAIIEQVIAELKDGALAHLPGSYAANAAWLAHAVIAFNLDPRLSAREAVLRTDGEAPERPDPGALSGL